MERTRRARLAEAGRRLRGARRPLAQCALAAALAWFIATAGFGYAQPFFAPAAAVITLGTTLGQRGRRAVEMAVGVATGIAIADLLILGIGTGAWQIGVVVGLAMGAAVLLGGSALLANQAGISAILVATIQPPTGDLMPHRFFHTLIGAAVALVVGQLLLPSQPLPIVLRAAEPVFARLGAVLERTARALAAGDRQEAEGALQEARAMDGQVRDLAAALSVASETARLSPTRRGQRQQLTVYADAITQIDLAVRNTRVLARASVAVLRHRRPDEAGRAVEVALSRAVAELADGVRALGAHLVGGGAPEDARAGAVAAAHQVSALFADPRELAVNRVAGQVRATAVDLLRSSGLGLSRALELLEERGAPPQDPDGG